MAYVTIVDGKITAKDSGITPTDTAYFTGPDGIDVPLEHKEISDELYEQLTCIPADFSIDEAGEIIAVTPGQPIATIPQPSQEDYLLDLDYRLSKIELGL